MHVIVPKADGSPIEGVAWQDLSVVLAVLDSGSLGKAAVALRIGQSTASRRLVRLEGRLGGSLFDRTPEGLSPTALAWAIEPHARLIADQMADIERVVHGLEAAPAGRVRVAVVDGLAGHWLMPSLPEFLERFGDLEIDLLNGQSVVDLVRREADLAVRFVRPTAPDLVCKTLGVVEFAPYAAPGLARRDRYVALHDPAEMFQETQWIRMHGAATQVHTVTAWYDLFGAVRAGVGVGLLAPQVAEPEGLVRLDLPPVPSRKAYLVYHRALRDVPRIAAVRAWLIEVARTFFS